MSRLVAVALLVALSAQAWAAAPAAKAKPKPPAAPPAPPKALEQTFVQGREAEQVWSSSCPLREEVTAGESKLLDLGLVKIVSGEVPIATFKLEKGGKVLATGFGPGLTVLAGLNRRGQRVSRCVRVVNPAGADSSDDLPSPGPCVQPPDKRALYIQSATLDPDVRNLMPAKGWLRFTVDHPSLVKVVGWSPDTLSLEVLAPGSTQLRIFLPKEFVLINLDMDAPARKP